MFFLCSHKASGRPHWGRVRDSIALLDEARARGLDVTADQYPYTAGSTVLRAVVGDEGLREMGEPDDVAKRIVISATPDHPEWVGKSLADLCAEWEGTEWGVDGDTAAARVREAEPNAWVVLHSMCDEDVCEVMRHEITMIGSDGIPTDGGQPHPRLYGTFARVLGDYARELGVLSLTEAVHRMTGLPAETFGLTERGFVRPGYFADLVVFDPERVSDRSTYTDSRRYPAGVHHVFVNGRAVVRDGVHTGARPGRTLPAC